LWPYFAKSLSGNSPLNLSLGFGAFNYSELKVGEKQSDVLGSLIPLTLYWEMIG
jgi:hypothetical protein